MASPSSEARRLAARYALGTWNTPRRGTAGDVLAQGTGASLEFQDRRAYAAGDDVRHLDWRAFARTDQLMVRLYRDELRPRLELLIDGSRSMSTDAAKAQGALDLAFVLARAAAHSGAEFRAFWLGDEPAPIEARELELGGREFGGRVSLVEVAQRVLPFLRAGSMRVVISDFLFPHSAAELVRPLQRAGAGLALVQVLSPFDAEPEAGEALRLVDSEASTSLDIWLDRAAVERYRGRLAALVDGLELETRRGGGRLFRWRAGNPLDVLCDRELVPAGLLEPS